MMLAFMIVLFVLLLAAFAYFCILIGAQSDRISEKLRFINDDMGE